MLRLGTSYRVKVLSLAEALAGKRGWPSAVSPKVGHFRLGATSRLSLQTRGRLAIATVTFPLDPDAPLDMPDDLARAIGAGLADITLFMTGDGGRP